MFIITEPQEPDAIELPGPMLKAAREAQGLTIDQMAERSHLTKQVIRSIENDEYLGLASLGLARGYIKLYAKKLGIDEAAILEMFDRWHNAQPHEETKSLEFDLQEKSELLVTQRNRWVVIGVAVVLGMVFAASLIYAVREYYIQSSVTEPTAQQRPVMSNTSNEVPLVAGDAESKSVELPAQKTLEEAGDPVQSVSRSQDTAEEVMLSADAPVASSEVAQILAESALVPTDPVANDEPEESSVEPAVSGADDEQLVLRVTGDSWIEVREESGGLIFADLLRAGRNVTVDVNGPFELLVGAVDVTTVIFNGEVLDLSDRASRNLARIRLGASQN